MARHKYNSSNAKSIEDFAKLLQSHSLKELYSEAQVFKGKGGLGEAVEFFHFGIEPNSTPEPDFKKVGLELKCTPLKELKDQSLVAKERLVLNIINYMDEADKTFKTSSFWHKNKFLLLMFYSYKKGVNPVDMFFKLIRTWKFPSEDLKIIKDDWNKIHNKIISGEAHLLTEGDTLYLSPCMKGSKSGEEMRVQPFSDELAQQRAYSLKQGYINKIILTSFLDEKISHELKLSERKLKSLIKKYSSEASEKIVKSTRPYKKNETFETLIERKMNPYYGKTVAMIEKKFKIEFNVESKDFAYNVCRAILGIKTKRIQEFENACITLKSVVLEAKRDKAKESMSFPYIRFTEIVNQEWTDSDWFKTLSSKFLFAVFRKSPDGDKREMQLVKVFFWNMPYYDLCKAEQLWLDTKQKVLANDYTHFITTKTNPVCHIRPHGTKGQTVLTPQGDMVQPKSFWLNNDYILDVVKKNIIAQ